LKKKTLRSSKRQRPLLDDHANVDILAQILQHHQQQQQQHQQQVYTSPTAAAVAVHHESIKPPPPKPNNRPTKKPTTRRQPASTAIPNKSSSSKSTKPPTPTPTILPTPPPTNIIPSTTTTATTVSATIQKSKAGRDTDEKFLGLFFHRDSFKLVSKQKQAVCKICQEVVRGTTHEFFGHSRKHKWVPGSYPVSVEGGGVGADRGAVDVEAWFGYEDLDGEVREMMFFFFFFFFFVFVRKEY
jgi:hypothetical protein